MLRTSCSILIKKLYEARKISKEKRRYAMEYVFSDETHFKTRNLIAMILLPKKLHVYDDSQAAYLRAAVSRVSYIKLISFISLLKLRSRIRRSLKMQVH